MRLTKRQRSTLRIICLLCSAAWASAFLQHPSASQRRPLIRRFVSSVDNDIQQESESLTEQLQETMGKVDKDRILFPEYDSGEVPRLFSSLEYVDQGGSKQAVHDSGSVLGAATLIAGTTIGAGVLAIPKATVAAGFLPSSGAMVVAWIYMTMSGLLIAELSLNRLATTGRRGLGLLDLMQNSLGPTYGKIGSSAYLFLHYAVMVAYIAQGGTNLEAIFGLEGLPDGVSQITFCSVTALALYGADRQTIEKGNNVLVMCVIASFAAICATGVGTADFGSLFNMANQHPELTVGCLPILFLSLVYQNVVPSVVDQLEGDRTKITQSIVAGTVAPLLLFLMWNAVVLGNVGSTGLENMDPVALLKETDNPMLGPLVTTFSSLAVLTSLVGFCYGLRDAWTDILKVDITSPEYDKNVKLPLFFLIFGPPLGLACANPDIFFDALDYGGAFGVSTLFLVLPPLMVWQQRYGDDKSPLVTKPLVPLGKLPLASMYKAAGTLIIEQGAEKLGVFAFIQENILSKISL